MNNKMEQLLYKQLDGELTPEENNLLEKAVIKDPNLKREWENLINMRELIASTKKEEFKPFFETRLMHRINTRGQKQFALQELFADAISKQFRKILVPAMIVILAIATYNLSSTGTINFNSLLGVPDVSVTDSVDPLNYLGLE